MSNVTPTSLFDLLCISRSSFEQDEECVWSLGMNVGFGFG